MKARKSILIIASITLLASAFWFVRWRTAAAPEFIKVGILYSLTGTMSVQELPTVDAIMLAIEEINAKGGILGKQISPVVFDGKSDWPTFAEGAEKLITQEKVDVIFGCWTSASRKTAKPVIEQHDHLLIYSVQYEGLEQSPNIFYLGATVNQQIIPGIVWSFENLGKSFFLIGSDYIYPRASYEIGKYVIRALGGTVVGEEYIPLGSRNVEEIVKKIVATKPAVILNNLVGESNIPFFEQLRAAGITSEKIPTMSFNFAEIDLQNLNINTMIGDYTAFNYFQSVDTKENTKFIEKFRKKFGEKRLVSDYMEVAYAGVYLWAQAAEEAGASNPKAVREYLKVESVSAPEGVISIKGENQHAWRICRIGKIQSNGEYGIVWASLKAIEPVPYPTEYQTKEAWDTFVNQLYEKWGNAWTAK